MGKSLRVWGVARDLFSKSWENIFFLIVIHGVFVAQLYFYTQ